MKKAAQMRGFLFDWGALSKKLPTFDVSNVRRYYDHFIGDGETEKVWKGERVEKWAQGSAGKRQKKA